MFFFPSIFTRLKPMWNSFSVFFSLQAKDRRTRRGLLSSIALGRLIQAYLKHTYRHNRNFPLQTKTLASTFNFLPIMLERSSNGWAFQQVRQIYLHPCCLCITPAYFPSSQTDTLLLRIPWPPQIPRAPHSRASFGAFYLIYTPLPISTPTPQPSSASSSRASLTHHTAFHTLLRLCTNEFNVDSYQGACCLVSSNFQHFSPRLQSLPRFRARRGRRIAPKRGRFRCLISPATTTAEEGPNRRAAACRGCFVRDLFLCEDRTIPGPATSCTVMEPETPFDPRSPADNTSTTVQCSISSLCCTCPAKHAGCTPANPIYSRGWHSITPVPRSGVYGR